MITDKIIAKIKTWIRITGGKTDELPYPEEFLFADDDIEMISTDTYDELVLPCHERLYSAMTKGKRGIHLCGRASRHYESLYCKLNVKHIDGPGIFIDHGYYLNKFGNDFSFTAQPHNTIFLYGDDEEIDRMFKNLMTPDAKVSGRFNVLGYIGRDCRIENIRKCYQAGLKYGRIENTTR